MNEPIQQNFTAAGSEQDVIVFSSDTLVVTDPEYRRVLDKVLIDVRDDDCPASNGPGRSPLCRLPSGPGA